MADIASSGILLTCKAKACKLHNPGHPGLAAEYP